MNNSTHSHIHLLTHKCKTIHHHHHPPLCDLQLQLQFYYHQIPASNNGQHFLKANVSCFLISIQHVLLQQPRRCVHNSAIHFQSLRLWPLLKPLHHRYPCLIPGAGYCNWSIRRCFSSFHQSGNHQSWVTRTAKTWGHKSVVQDNYTAQFGKYNETFSSLCSI